MGYETVTGTIHEERPTGSLMRRTKIIATLGPATDSPQVLSDILHAGVDVVRLNAAHSDTDELEARLRKVRDAASEVGREIGVLVDLPGPKIRVGDVAPGTQLVPGSEFRLVSDECVGDSEHACVTHKRLADDMSPGDRVLVDDGRIELSVVSTGADEVTTRVITGGPLSANKGVNVPGVTLSVEPITPFDHKVLGWAMGTDVDWMGQSFIRSAADVAHLRTLMTARSIPIIAKIEKHEAVSEIDAIVQASDAVMVARGDLGVETSPERVPVLQREIVGSARAAGRPVVIATEMLDSMRSRPRPTRAEASDVANAIFNRADAVMLSGETAVGDYPVDSVATMSRIALTAEEAWPPPRPPRGTGGDDVQAAVSAVVSDLAQDLRVAAIITLTQSGATALAVSRYRPDIPIIAVTPSVEVVRRLSLAWGIRALEIPFAEETQVLLDTVIAAIKEEGYVQSGQRVAMTAGLGSLISGGTNFVHVRTV